MVLSKQGQDIEELVELQEMEKDMFKPVKVCRLSEEQPELGNSSAIWAHHSYPLLSSGN
jgi:hypothetical protein